MSIYDIDFDLAADRLNVPNKRKTRMTAFLKVLMKPLNWLHSIFFNDYVNGQTYAGWSSVITYSFGTIRTYNRANYYCIKGNLNKQPDINPDYWYKLQDVYIGLNERVAYSAQKMIFEYALNQYFNSSPTAMPNIYITNTANLPNDIFVYNYDFPYNDGGFYSYAYSVSNQTQFSYAYGYSIQEYSFEVFVPTAIFSALDSNPTYAENILRNYIDKYNTTSVKYKINTY